jgi:alpha-glucosidase (family GH31 glycosyl hydrolase)
MLFADKVNIAAFSYWNNEFQLFYNPATGIDIDGAWIDMNEPSSVRLAISAVPPITNFSDALPT